MYLLYFRLKNEGNNLREKGLLKQIEKVVKRNKHSFLITRTNNVNKRVKGRNILPNH